MSLRFVIFALSVSANLGCQAKISASDRHGAAKPAVDEVPGPESQAEPIESSSGLDLVRTYFQSRAPITIAIRPEAAVPGDKFSLFNDSTQATLIDSQAIALVDDELRSRSYHFDEIVDDYAALAAYELTLTLFPLDPGFDQKFAYGANELRLLVDSATGQHFVRSYITRADFPFLSLASGTFAKGMQRVDGFEGGVSKMVQQSVSNGESVLTLGKVSLFSR